MVPVVTLAVQPNPTQLPSPRQITDLRQITERLTDLLTQIRGHKLLFQGEGTLLVDPELAPAMLREFAWRQSQCSRHIDFYTYISGEFSNAVTGVERGLYTLV